MVEISSEFFTKLQAIYERDPNLRDSEAAPLEFLVEEDRRRYKVDEVRTGSLEESIVWQGLQKNFRESIGKVRVFAHPEYRNFLNAYLSRTEIETAVDGALRKVDSE